jgi:hypothetical protein
MQAGEQRLRQVEDYTFQLDGLPSSDWVRILGEAVEHYNVEQPEGFAQWHSHTLELWARPENRPLGWPPDATMDDQPFGPGAIVATVYSRTDFGFVPGVEHARNKPGVRLVPVMARIAIPSLSCYVINGWRQRGLSERDIAERVRYRQDVRVAGDERWVMGRWAELIRYADVMPGLQLGSVR